MDGDLVAGKNIVVFSDGTAQEGGEGHNSNVYKLFNMIEDRTDKQVAFYDRGLGTGWRKISGSISGKGISKNIIECYRFIFDNFEADDTIYLLGFSRGAATVRSLSGFIHFFGILPKSRPELIKKAYKIYSARYKGCTKEEKAKNRKAAVEAFVERHHNMWCNVKFLGVWDTVAALGFPLKPVSVVLDRLPLWRHRFHDLRMSESVEHGRHALAIDDRRLTFHPELWDAEPTTDDRSMKQVWFCGMHSDVGGGYEEKGLSDIPLTWMLKEATTCGLLIYKRHKVELDPDPNGTMHDTSKGVIGKIYRKKTRSWSIDTHGTPVVHQSVLNRKLGTQNTASPSYDPWILGIDPDVEP